MASQLCEKKMKVEPLVIISCPEGYVEIDNQECMKEEVTAPIRVCALKKKKNDECEGVERETPKVAKCPAGTEKIKNKCIQVGGTSMISAIIAYMIYSVRQTWSPH